MLGADGTIYCADADRIFYGRLYALRPDGRLYWEYQLGAMEPDAVVATPAVAADGTLYVAGAKDQQLHAIGPAGQRAWTFAAGAALTSPPAIGGDGTVYFGAKNGRLYAIEGAGSGLAPTQWPRYRRDARHRGGHPRLPDTPPGAPASFTASVDTFTEKTVIAWSSVPGATEYDIWRGTEADALTILSSGVAAVTDFDDLTATPGLDYSYALQASNAAGPGPLSRPVLGRRRIAKPGEVMWKCGVAGGARAPVVGRDGTIHFSTGDGRIRAVDTSGAKRWEFDFQGTLSGGLVLGPTGTVYFTAATRLNQNVARPEGHALFALGPDGTSQWRHDFAKGTTRGLALAKDGTLYALVQEDTATMALVAFSPDGQPRWHLKQPEEAPEVLAIGADGTVYFATQRGHLSAVSPAGTLL